MNEPADCPDLDLMELCRAVDELRAVLAESWFREMAVCEVGEQLDELADLLDRTGPGG
jgi:hypothetical protein